MAMEISGNYGGGYVSSYASQAKSDVGKTDLDKKVDKGKSASLDSSKDVGDYYSYLQENYDCMKSGNVSVSGKYLQQCAGDSKKAKELEDFLKKIPELEKQGYEQLSAQNAALGGKVTFYQQTWMINDDGSVQSSVYSVTETEMTNAERMKKNMDERLEKQKEKKEEEEMVKERKEEKTEQEERIKKGEGTIKIPKMKDISVKYIEAETEEDALALMQKEKKEGAYYPRVDVSI